MRIKAHKMITKKIVLFLLLIGFQLSAQTKKWTLEECVDYAIKNNILLIHELMFFIKKNSK